VWKLEFSHDAVKALLRMPRDEARRVRGKLDRLARDPCAMPGVKQLTGHPGFRLRIGDWRVLYILHDQRIVIHVIRIARRGDAYR
jgi:mRNA interferase RelE/StbE